MKMSHITTVAVLLLVFCFLIFFIGGASFQVSLAVSLIASVLVLISFFGAYFLFEVLD